VNSVWQSDRVLWQDGEASITLDLRAVQEINKLIWINGFANNTPTKYSIEISLDGREWKEAKSVTSVRRIDTKKPQVVSFDSQKARFVKMVIRETLGGDSPAIAEIWVAPSKFTDLDIKKAEEFLHTPFGYIENKEIYLETLRMVQNKGAVQLFWQSDKSPGWQTDFNSRFDLVYDGVRRRYSLTLPATGTKISGIKLSNMEIPGHITLKGVKIRHPSLEEIVK
jgi:hypothetical protein